MKIKDLPKSTNLQEVAVQMPDLDYEMTSLPRYGIKNVPVYLQGWVMGDFFVKIDKGSNKIYPMFWSQIPDGIEEWEVVDEKFIKNN